MTKKVLRWWKRQSFWNKLQGTLLSLGVGSEITLFISESHPKWKGIAAVATISAMVITKIFEDKNNNNVSDIFEKE